MVFGYCAQYSSHSNSIQIKFSFEYCLGRAKYPTMMPTPLDTCLFHLSLDIRRVRIRLEMVENSI
jgi:hypothetical protein